MFKHMMQPDFVDALGAKLQLRNIGKQIGRLGLLDCMLRRGEVNIDISLKPPLAASQMKTQRFSLRPVLY